MFRQIRVKKKNQTIKFGSDTGSVLNNLFLNIVKNHFTVL